MLRPEFDPLMTLVNATQSPHASRGERRLLTVMFCDLMGSTELANRLDPEELRDVMDAYRSACAKVVARYDGHVAQWLGDGVLSYFGWPKAHEDDAERAVRAALEIVQVVKGVSAANPLAVHIGIASGTVVVGGRGQGETGDAALAVGDTPNLAAGLQSHAAAGEVVIAASTRRLIGDAFDLAELGELRLKGAKPLSAWRVQGLRNTEGRFHAAHGGAALTPMVNRKDELELLLGQWRIACSGSGRAVLVGGEAGIGKSRLTEVFRDRISGTQHTTLRYQCSPFHVHAALHPVVTQLEFVAGFSRDDSTDAKLVKLEAVIVGDDAQRATAAPLLADLLGLPTGRYPALGLTPEQRKERLFETMIEQLELLCGRHPVLIVVEDAHWIDPTTQELLDGMVARLPRLPAMLVLTHRPRYATRWGDASHVSGIALASLPDDLSAELAANVAKGEALPIGVLQEVVKRGDGVPLFIEEVTKSVLESRLPLEGEDRYTLLKPLPAVIPEKVNAQLIERLDSRGGVRWLAQIGACVGREFSYELLSAISPQQGAGFDQELEELTETGLVFRRGTPPHATYAFKHALVRVAAYESMLRSDRPYWHSRVADALDQLYPELRAKEPELLAHHLTEAQRPTEAIPLWRSAGEAALGRVALQEAVAYLQEGLGLLERVPDSDERDGFELSLRELLHLARLRWQGWAAPEVGTNAEALLRLATSRTPPHQQGVLVGLWGIWVNTITKGRIADSPEWAQRLLDEGTKSGNIDLQILGHRAFVSSNLYLGKLHESVAERERALALYDTRHARRWMELTGNDVRTAVGIFASQAMWILGYPDRAAAVCEQRDADARAVGHPFDIGWSLTWGGYVYDFRREPHRLMQGVREADRLAREQIIPVLWRALVPIAEGLASLRQGELARAATSLRQGMTAWKARGGHLNQPYLKSALAEAIARQGDLDGGLRLLEECLEQIARPGWNERVWLPEVLRLKGWMLAQQGHADAAEAELRASLAAAQAQQARSWELRTATTLAKLLEKGGRRAEARDVLAPVYAWFTEGFDTYDLETARTLLERLA